jgi:hypothetical protein
VPVPGGRSGRGTWQGSAGLASPAQAHSAHLSPLSSLASRVTFQSKSNEPVPRPGGNRGPRTLELDQISDPRPTLTPHAGRPAEQPRRRGSGRRAARPRLSCAVRAARSARVRRRAPGRGRRGGGRAPAIAAAQVGPTAAMSPARADPARRSGADPAPTWLSACGAAVQEPGQGGALELGVSGRHPVCSA